MDFTDIEDAIKTRIRSRMAYAKSVETYAGELEGEIGELATPFPAIFVAYKGSDYDWVDGRTMRDTPRFSVMAAASDLRGSEDLRKGTHGCYRMIKDILAALANDRLGLPAMEPLRPVKVSLLFITRTMAAYSIDFVTGFDTDFS